MAFDRKAIAQGSRAAFYAALYPELRKAAADCGWALGLHGSLASDMDIMAMAWVEDAADADTMIKSLITCFDSCDSIICSKDTTSKPNNRTVYTISIWADFYLDVNIITY